MATKSKSKAAAAYRPVKGNDKLELAVDLNQPELTGSKQQPTKAAPLQLVASNSSGNPSAGNKIRLAEPTLALNCTLFFSTLEKNSKKRLNSLARSKGFNDFPSLIKKNHHVARNLILDCFSKAEFEEGLKQFNSKINLDDSEVADSLFTDLSEQPGQPG